MTQRLRALVQFLPQFEEANFKFGTLIEPESKMGVIRLPFWSQSAEAEAFVKAAYDNGWVRDFDWPAWSQTSEAEELLSNHESIAEATVEQIEALLTLCIRKDRFYDGFLVDAHESGLLSSILRRAAALLQESSSINKGHWQETQEGN